MKRYLVPLVLIVGALFFWPDRNPIVITRIARVILCSFILAPCITGILLYKHNKWISLLLIWLGLVTFLNILLGFISVNTASIEMMFFLALALIFYYVHKLNIDTKIVTTTIVCMTIFQALLGVFQYFTGMYFPFENNTGLKVAVGFLDNTPNFGVFLAMGLPFVFSFHWLAGLFVLFAIILCKSLTGLIAGVIGICVFYNSKKLMIAGMVLIAVFFFFYKTQLLNITGSSALIRYNIWQASAKISVYKPVIGYGLGNYKIIMPQYMEQNKIQYIGEGELWDNPSNDYVRAVFESGFPVLIFLFGFIYTTIKKYYHLSKRLDQIAFNFVITSDSFITYDLRLYFSSFISILVICLGYSLFLNPTNIIWAVVIISLLNSELNKKEIKCCY